MNCPSCRTPSEPGRKFCAECGTRLSATCPSCGAAKAGLAALDGRPAEAVAAYRAAIADWRDLGLPWDEALTSIEFVRLVGTEEPDARAAAVANTHSRDGVGDAVREG